MNIWTKQRKGSESRDLFKYLHKTLLPGQFYALDSDFELVEKYPIPFIVARLDFKLKGDIISFSEAIAYNQLVVIPEPYRIPVYIIEAYHPFIGVDSCEHRFAIYRYEYADWRPDPPAVRKKLLLEDLTWGQLDEWENALRESQRLFKKELFKKVV